MDDLYRFAAGGRRVLGFAAGRASSGRGEPAWLLRVSDGNHLAIATPRFVTDACFSADGNRLYAVGEGGLLRAWTIDLADRQYL
jgi:hypothetical protein